MKEIINVLNKGENMEILKTYDEFNNEQSSLSQYVRLVDVGLLAYGDGAIYLVSWNDAYAMDYWNKQWKFGVSVSGYQTYISNKH